MRRVLSLAAAVALTFALAFPGVVSAFSPNGLCQGQMTSMSTIGFGPGYWSTGVHTYSVHFVDTYPGDEFDGTFGPYSFTVSDTAPIYKGNVNLPTQDFWGGLWSEQGPVPDNTISPAQGTFFYSGWIWDMTGQVYGGPPYTTAQAKAELAVSPIYFSWDGGPEVLGNPGPLKNGCDYGLDKAGIGYFNRTWGKKF